MRALSILFGFLAAVGAGALALVTVGEIPAVVFFLVFLVTGFVGAGMVPEWRKWIVGLLVVAFFASAGILGIGVIRVAQAIGSTTGTVDAADPEALAAADAKFDEARSVSAFRLVLTETEMTAALRDKLADRETSLRAVNVDFIGEQQDDPGEVRFHIEFKRGGVEADGVASIALVDGLVKAELEEVDFGLIALPGAARSFAEDLTSELFDFNDGLLDANMDVQHIRLTDQAIVIVGTTTGGPAIGEGELIDSIRNASVTLGIFDAPFADVPVGRVADRSAPGEVYYLSIGDSLAAGVGVEDQTLSMTSRFHAVLEQRDGVTYGLENISVPGETTASFIRNGQLDRALAFLAANNVAYVTVSLGGNDMIGHLGSEDCNIDISENACQERLIESFARAEENLTTIAERIAEAAPEATVIFLAPYNPFSLGLGEAIAFEVESNAAIVQFADIVRLVAGRNGMLSANGQSFMVSTTGATTHMLDAVPDIHPDDEGYALLTFVLQRALPEG